MLATLVLASGLGACGGESLSKEDFAKEASRICRDLEKKVKGIGEGATDREDVGKALDEVIDETQRSVDELKDLELPEGDAGDAAGKFVDTLESEVEDQAVPAFEKLREAVKSNDQAATGEALEEIEKLERENKSDRFARDLGAKACAG